MAVALALFLTCAGIGVRRALPLFWDDWQEALDMERGGKEVLAFAPPGSAVLGPQNEILHLQFAGDYRLYSRNLFVHHFIAELGRIDGRAPNALQPERAQALFSRLRGRSRPELARLERDLMAAQLRQGRRVFLLSPVQNQHWLEFANDPAARPLERAGRGASRRRARAGRGGLAVAGGDGGPAGRREALRSAPPAERRRTPVPTAGDLERGRRDIR